MTKENALFNKKLKFLINFKSAAQSNLHNGVYQQSSLQIAVNPFTLTGVARDLNKSLKSRITDPK